MDGQTFSTEAIIFVEERQVENYYVERTTSFTNSTERY